MEFQGEHTSNPNATSYNDIGICVAFIGTFEVNQLSDNQIRAFNSFISYYVKSNVIDEDYKLFSQHQLMKMSVVPTALANTINSWKKFYSSEWNLIFLKLKP